MILGEERIRHLAHLIFEALENNPSVEISERVALLNDIKRALTRYLEIDDQIDDLVRKKIKSYARRISEGSREWDVMYDKIFNEELKKKGMDI